MQSGTIFFNEISGFDTNVKQLWVRGSVHADEAGQISGEDVEKVIKLYFGSAPPMTGANLIYGTVGDVNAEYSYVPTGWLFYSADIDNNNTIEGNDVETVISAYFGNRPATEGQGLGNDEHWWGEYDTDNQTKLYRLFKKSEISAIPQAQVTDGKIVLKFTDTDNAGNARKLKNAWVSGTAALDNIKTRFRLYKNDNSGEINITSIEIDNDNFNQTLGDKYVTLTITPADVSEDTPFYLRYAPKYVDGTIRPEIDETLLFNSFVYEIGKDKVIDNDSNEITSPGVIKKGAIIPPFKITNLTLEKSDSSVTDVDYITLTVTKVGQKYKIVYNGDEFIRSISLLHDKYKFDISNANNFEITNSNGVKTGVHGTTEIDIEINSRTPTLYFSDSTNTNTGGVIYILPPWLGPPSQDQ